MDGARHQQSNSSASTGHSVLTEYAPKKSVFYSAEASLDQKLNIGPLKLCESEN